MPNLESVSAFQVQAALDAILGHYECRSDADDVMDALAVMCRFHYLPDDDVLSGVIMSGKPFVHLPAFETRSMAWAYFSQPARKSSSPMFPTRDELQPGYYDDGVISFLFAVAITLAIQVDVGIYAESVLTKRLRGHARQLPKQAIPKYVTEHFSAEPNQPFLFWRRVQGVPGAIGAEGKLGGCTPGAMLQAALECNLVQPLVLSFLGLKLPFPMPHANGSSKFRHRS